MLDVRLATVRESATALDLGRRPGRRSGPPPAASPAPCRAGRSSSTPASSPATGWPRSSRAWSSGATASPARPPPRRDPTRRPVRGHRRRRRSSPGPARGRGRHLGPRPRQHPLGREDPGLARGARPARSSRPLGVEVHERDDAWLAEQGFGGVLAVGGGSAAPPRLIEAALAAARCRAGTARRARRQGHHLRHRRLNRKTGTGMNTMYTDMSGGAAVLGALHAIAAAAPAGARHRARPRRRELAVRRGLPARRRRAALRRAHQRDRQHRRRGPAGAGRRARLRRWRGCARPRSSTSRPSPARRRWRWAPAPPPCSRRPTTLAAALHDAGERAGEPLWRLPHAGRVRRAAATRRSPTRRTRRATRGRSPPRCSCAVRRRRAVGAPRHRRARPRRPRTTACSRAAPPASASGCCAELGRVARA